MPVDPGIRLVVDRAMPPLDPALDAIVDQHWQRASARARLFNGRVFCVDLASPSLLCGHWTEYRRVVAQMENPALVPHLRVRSLAVCGILCGPGGVAAARREPRSAYLAGQWQLPPAGSVDRHAATAAGADWRLAVLAELREELGVDPSDIGAMTPLCLVQHPTGVLDLGIRIDTPLDPAALQDRHARLGDGEYDRLLVAPPADLMGRIGAEGGQASATVPLFLDALRQASA